MMFVPDKGMVCVHCAQKAPGGGLNAVFSGNSWEVNSLSNDLISCLVGFFNREVIEKERPYTEMALVVPLIRAAVIYHIHARKENGCFKNFEFLENILREEFDRFNFIPDVMIKFENEKGDIDGED